MDGFFEILMEKGIFDIHLVKRPIHRSSNTYKCTTIIIFATRAKAHHSQYHILDDCLKQPTELYTCLMIHWVEFDRISSFTTNGLTEARHEMISQVSFFCRAFNFACIAFCQYSYFMACEYEVGIEMEDNIATKEVWGRGYLSGEFPYRLGGWELPVDWRRGGTVMDSSTRGDARSASTTDSSRVIHLSYTKPGLNCVIVLEGRGSFLKSGSETRDWGEWLTWKWKKYWF